jgi:DNA-binding XRE family transcriptional regulator
MPKSTLVPIESLQQQLRKRFPEATIEIDRPRKSSGIWYLDLRRNNHPLIIQWQSGKGFGVSSSLFPSAQPMSRGRPTEARKSWDKREPPGSLAAETSIVPAFGEGADEVYPDVEATYGRAVSLLLSGAYTSPPEAIRLSELRKERGISQAELAEILHKQQGEISKIERRQDVKLSTLRDYVNSVGGTLQILARMPDGIVRAIEMEDEQKKAPRKKALTE